MEQLILDELCRIQIPLTIREKLGLKPTDRLTLELHESQLILKPSPQELETGYEDGILVVKTQPFDNSDKIIDDLRSEQLEQFLSW